MEIPKDLYGAVLGVPYIYLENFEIATDSSRARMPE